MYINCTNVRLMRFTKYLLLSLILFLSSHLESQEILDVSLIDGKKIKVRLSLPQTDVDSFAYLVLFIHGTGPNTYLNKRGTGENSFNYYDLYADRFNDQGIAFATYNRRGVTINDVPPMYHQIDSATYATYTSQSEVADIESIIDQIKKIKKFRNTKVILLGWSEGTIIASMVADKMKSDVHMLLLCGYAHESMYDIMKWQLSGASTMININKYFDKNGNGVIERDEYESDDKNTTFYRDRFFNNATFDLLDNNTDAQIDKFDFEKNQVALFNVILEKIEQNDHDWIWNNYYKVTPQWFKSHFKLEANKKRLLRLNLPIYIFHGKDDANTPVDGVYDLIERCREYDKTNIKAFIFDDHDHDLNYGTWIRNNELSKGLKKLFETVNELKD